MLNKHEKKVGIKKRKHLWKYNKSAKRTDSTTQHIWKQQTFVRNVIIEGAPHEKLIGEKGADNQWKG